MSFKDSKLPLELLLSTSQEIFELISSDENVALCEETKDYKELLEYTCIGGKSVRGLQAMISAQTTSEHFHSNFDWKEAAILGVIVEVLEGSFLVADDIMDGAYKRRVFLEDVIGKTTLGQKIDGSYSFQRSLVKAESSSTSISSLASNYTLSTLKDFFSYERHRRICQYKTSYYTFFLPVGLGILYGIPAEELKVTSSCSPLPSSGTHFFSNSPYAIASYQSLFRDVEDTCIEMGVLFQSQDDYIDVYSDAMKTGKIGTDIEDGKLSFLLVLALNYKDDAIRGRAEKIIMEHYAIKEKSHIDAVKDFYKEINLEAVYKEHEEKMAATVEEKVAQYSTKHKFFPTQMFLDLLESQVKRQR